MCALGKLSGQCRTRPFLLSSGLHFLSLEVQKGRNHRGYSVEHILVKGGNMAVRMGKRYGCDPSGKWWCEPKRRRKCERTEHFYSFSFVVSMKWHTFVTEMCTIQGETSVWHRSHIPCASFHFMEARPRAEMRHPEGWRGWWRCEWEIHVTLVYAADVRTEVEILPEVRTLRVRCARVRIRPESVNGILSLSCFCSCHALADALSAWRSTAGGIGP